MKSRIILMNFTHVYEKERFVGNHRLEWVDCTDLNGTDCYCDQHAAKEIIKRISPFPPDGIHFIDSGNYHYLSKFWIDKINYPFSLVVFDHHPDMQPTLFEDMLSCGSWVKDVLDTNPYLRKVLIVGASEALIQAIFPKNKKVKFYSDVALSQEQGWKRFSGEQINEPVYISVDKDVLNTQSA